MGGKYESVQMDPGTYDYLTLTILVADNNQIESDSEEPFQKSERELTACHSKVQKTRQQPPQHRQHTKNFMNEP